MIRNKLRMTVQILSKKWWKPESWFWNFFFSGSSPSSLSFLENNIRIYIYGPFLLTQNNILSFPVNQHRCPGLTGISCTNTSCCPTPKLTLYHQTVTLWQAWPVEPSLSSLDTALTSLLCPSIQYISPWCFVCLSHPGSHLWGKRKNKILIHCSGDTNPQNKELLLFCDC